MTRVAFKHDPSSPPESPDGASGARFTWHEEAHVVHHSFGPDPWIERVRASVSRNRHRPYDVRVIDDADDLARLDVLERAIQALRNQRADLIAQRFAAWRPIGPADCGRVIPGQSLADAQAEVAALTALGRQLGAAPAGEPQLAKRVRADG